MEPVRTRHAEACLLGTAGHRPQDMHRKWSVFLGLTNIPDSKEHGKILKWSPIPTAGCVFLLPEPG